MNASFFRFGFFPQTLKIDAQNIRVRDLPKLQETIDQVSTSAGVDGDDIFAPPMQIRTFGDYSGVRAAPYPSRVFGLPKTHSIQHDRQDGAQHIEFLVWIISFVFGIRLTTTQMGYLDNTPIKLRRLVDFVVVEKEAAALIELSDQFWLQHKGDSSVSKLICGTIHNLFLAQRKNLLEFEVFSSLYQALEACYLLTKKVTLTTSDVKHSERTEWVCKKLGLEAPDWAKPGSIPNAINRMVTLRNSLVHEGLYVSEPVGFETQGNSSRMLEMKALVCRLLCSILNFPSRKYIESPVNTRQCFALLD
jgi:hypothetical protein